MKVYLVGGAVRDKLLGLAVKERDYVVVGATEKELVKLGFKKVGREFPVFLHPKTHEEYALARTERKTGKGYTNFICHFEPTVTLQEDLKRRDLTINAIAKDASGRIIDPYGGVADLKKKILRHLSLAFIEDPVRVLRVARFAARFSEFKVATKTNKLMKEMVANGEIDALIPERVWQELKRALGEVAPHKFFTVLKSCNALVKLFPEIACHLSSAQKILKKATGLVDDGMLRFAALATALDINELKNFCKRYKLPNNYRDLAVITNRVKAEHGKYPLTAEEVISLLEKTDGYRNQARLQQALIAYEANGGSAKLKKQISAAYSGTKAVRLSKKTIDQTPKNQLRAILHKKRVDKIKKGGFS